MRSLLPLALLLSCRLEDFHRSPEFSAVMPTCLQSPRLLWLFLLLFSHRTRVAYLPFRRLNKKRKYRRIFHRYWTLFMQWHNLPSSLLCHFKDATRLFFIVCLLLYEQSKILYNYPKKGEVNSCLVFTKSSG